MSWYIYESEPGRSKGAVKHLRQRGLPVIQLVAFPEGRVHWKAKAKKPVVTKPVPALASYLCMNVATAEDRFNIETLPIRVTRMRRGRDLAPALSDAGVRFFMNPPRGLYHDTDVPEIQKACHAAPDFKPGENVGVFSHGFTGLRGSIVSISRDLLRVEFESGMFVDVPAHLAAKVA